MVWYIWASLGVLAIVFEVASPTFFALFVGLGFLGSALLSFFIENSLIWQILLALLGMFIGVIIFKRQKIANEPGSKVGQSDEFIGMRGKVIQEITAESHGSVKLDFPVLGNSQWSAHSESDVALSVGTPIEIIAIHGNYLVVKSLSN